MTPPRRVAGAEIDWQAFQRCGTPQPAVPILRAVIDADGRVESVAMHRETGNPCIERLLVETIAGWTFAPAFLEGEPVRVEYILTMTINYR